PRRGAHWSERWILFEGRAAQAYGQLGCLGAAHPVRRPGDVLELDRGFRELAALARDPASLSRDVTAAALLHRLIALTAPPPPPATHGPASVADRAVALLDAHDGRPVSLSVLARRLGVSPDTLTDAVRTATGCTPTEYLLRRRIARAKSLLTTTDLTVSAVGRRVGYDDPAYFSRLFTLRVGTPPSRFRHEQAAGAVQDRGAVPERRPGDAGTARARPASGDAAPDDPGRSRHSAAPPSSPPSLSPAPLPPREPRPAPRDK
ncbi:AraC family transcriptional regulator, partial [Streptomyces sp. SID14478]|uniref:helix-turn-helix domain-containing protein n=1 Tax=Streptomyces sp. SID14478 TaxID=2706073 RepID=UPI001EF194E2